MWTNVTFRSVFQNPITNYRTLYIISCLNSNLLLFVYKLQKHFLFFYFLQHQLVFCYPICNLISTLIISYVHKRTLVMKFFENTIMYNIEVSKMANIRMYLCMQLYYGCKYIRTYSQCIQLYPIFCYVA